MMKNLKLFIISFLIFICCISTVCFATNTDKTASNTEPITNDVTSGETTQNSLKTQYLYGQDIVIDKPVEGNVFVVGNNVTVKSNINGDLFVLANTVTIESSAIIYSNVFVAAKTAVMNGTTYDVYAAVQKLTIGNSAFIYRDLNILGDSLILQGKIHRDVHMDIHNISIAENAKGLIEGDLYYSSSAEVKVPDGLVNGEVHYTQSKTANSENIISNYFMSFLTTIIFALVVILLVVFFAPKFVEKVNYALMKRPFISAGIGILSFVLIPVLAILLVVLTFTMYISFAVLAVYALILSVALAIVSLAVGKFLNDKMKTPSKGKLILFAVASAIVLWALKSLPYINTYISTFILIMGLGTFLFAIFKGTTKLPEKKA